MKSEEFVLHGKHIRLESLAHRHRESLVAAAEGNAELYKWSPVPQDAAAAEKYIETALAWKAARTAFPFVIVRAVDNVVVGSTRFWNIERWAWPVGHKLHSRETPDASEIGYTWFTASAIRTGANTEAKFLMLSHAFETWQVFRVCFHTDVRNDRSRAALARLGAREEGVLRAHRMAADFIPRDSVRFSIIAAEWPEVKQRLLGLLNRH